MSTSQRITPVGPDPILASWKVSEVLRRHPDLVETFVGLSPAFRPLRNALARRTQARLVTVAQAAQIAGVKPAVLVRALNVAAGLAPPADDTAEAAEQPADAPSWLDRAPVAVEFDTRPLLARGDEPFAAIMRAATEVPAGQVFRLRAPFDPLPLYDALGRRGFTGWGRQRGQDDWEISFLNEGRPRAAEATPTPPERENAGAWQAPAATVTIDVSELVPPEPMVKILEALAALAPGEVLLIHHVRRPVHLYTRLDEMGYRHETRELEPGRVEVLIQKSPAAGDGQ